MEGGPKNRDIRSSAFMKGNPTSGIAPEAFPAHLAMGSADSFRLNSVLVPDILSSSAHITIMTPKWQLNCLGAGQLQFDFQQQITNTKKSPDSSPSQESGLSNTP
jgi:hypothetical protein